MKTLLSIFLFLALSLGAQTYYVNTNNSPTTATTNLPYFFQTSNGAGIFNPTISQLTSAGWYQISFYQQPASNYTATNWFYSNSGPTTVGIYIATNGSYDNNSNIVAQWTSSLKTNALLFKTLLSKYIGNNYTSAVVTPALSAQWVAQQQATNASFSVSNAVDVINAINLSGDLINAPGNLEGTTATFRWDLFNIVQTNGVIP